MKHIKLLVFFLLFLTLFTACSTNRPPLRPGKLELLPGGALFEFTFSASTTDPDDDDISYQFDWGDGIRSEWSDFISSGDTITESHTYAEGGEFEIKVRAQDAEMLTSWSSPLRLYFSH
jgi:hypothetical protein